MTVLAFWARGMPIWIHFLSFAVPRDAASLSFYMEVPRLNPYPVCEILRLEQVSQESKGDIRAEYAPRSGQCSVLLQKSRRQRNIAPKESTSH